MASSHDTDVKIWDMRKGSTPLTHITAHFSKICGIDWSRTDEKEILTCSQDTMIKVWNLDNVSTFLTGINTSAPCWRARFTPFGNGIVSMPQRKDSNLYLWDRYNPSTPAYKFEGHEQIATEFIWRERPEGVKDCYQLITWSKDNHLRFWPVSLDIMKSVSGNDPNEDVTTPTSLEPIRISRNSRNTHASSESLLYRFSADSVSSLGAPNSLNSDHSSMGDDQIIEAELHRIEAIQGVPIDRSLWPSRKCVITLETPKLPGVSLAPNSKYQLQVEVVFPRQYPEFPPYFELRKTFMISMISKRAMSRKLIQISNNCATKKKPCVELCVRFLLGGTPDLELPQSVDSNEHIESMASRISLHDGYQPDTDQIRPNFLRNENSAIIVDELSSDDDMSSEDGNNLAMGKSFAKSFAAVKDSGQNVPYPRLCGAVFSPTGTLCFFFSPFPHPSTTKFTSYTLTTRNQQPILQSQKFNTQPHNFPMYEQYRNFILSKCPRMYIRNNTIRSVPSLVESTAALAETESKSDRKLDHWLDEDDNEEEQASLAWRLKPTSSVLQPQTLNTFDFLARLSSFSIKRPTSFVDSPLGNNNPTENPTINFTQANIDGDDKHLRVRTISTALSERKIEANLDLMGIPYEEAGDIEYLSTFNPGETRRLSANFKLSDEPSSMFPPPNDLKKQDADDGHGAMVYLMPLDSLLPISSSVAKLYKTTGFSKFELCNHNRNVALNHGREDLAQLWELLQLSTEISSYGESQQWKLQLFDDIINYLDTIDDFQMISVMVSILMAPSHDQNTRTIQKSGGDQKLKSALNLKPSRLRARAKPETQLLGEEDLFKTSQTLLERVRYFPKPNIMQCISQYADYLYNLGYFIQRAELLKNISLRADTTSIRINADVPNLQCTCFEGSCDRCDNPRVGRCPICRLPIHNMVTLCSNCSHGGHLQCIKLWIQQGSGCPLGCGCECTF